MISDGRYLCRKKINLLTSYIEWNAVHFVYWIRNSDDVWAKHRLNSNLNKNFGWNFSKLIRFSRRKFRIFRFRWHVCDEYSVGHQTE